MNTLSSSFRKKKNNVAENQQHEYTRWANGWLAKKRMQVFSLQQDFRSGVVFSALIELVGGVTLYGIDQHPTSKPQQDGNINSCLEFLAQRGLQPENVRDSTGIILGDVICIMSVVHQISKLDPNSKLKPIDLKALRSGKKTLDRQLSDKYPTYRPASMEEHTSSATLVPCSAKSMPVLYRSSDSLPTSDVRRSYDNSQEVTSTQEVLSPSIRHSRPNSFELSPETPAIKEDQDFNDEGIIQIGQRKIREAQHSESVSYQNSATRPESAQTLSLKRNGQIMDKVMVKVNGNHSIRHCKPLLSGPVSPLHPLAGPQTQGQPTAQTQPTSSARDQVTRDQPTARDQVARDQPKARDQVARDQPTVRDQVARDQHTARNQVARDQHTSRDQVARDQISRGQPTVRDQVARGQPTARDQVARDQHTARDQVARDQAEQVTHSPLSTIPIQLQSKSKNKPPNHPPIPPKPQNRRHPYSNNQTQLQQQNHIQQHAQLPPQPDHFVQQRPHLDMKHGRPQLPPQGHNVQVRSLKQGQRSPHTQVNLQQSLPPQSQPPQSLPSQLLSPPHPASVGVESNVQREVLYDHLGSTNLVTQPSHSESAVIRVCSTDCLSNTDNNSSRFENISDRNSFNSLHWDNTSHRSDINLSNNSLDDPRTQKELQFVKQIKWLKRELEKSKSKEESSCSQLNTNSHMLAAFQQSIDSLSSRLENEVKQNELKDREIKTLRGASGEASSTLVGGEQRQPNSGSLQHNGSYSDFSDIDNEGGPSHFDRNKKTRKSWKGSLTRAFSRKRKDCNEEWDSGPPNRELILSPKDLEKQSLAITIDHLNPKLSNDDAVCTTCQQLQCQISALTSEINEQRDHNKPTQNSLVNYIRDEMSGGEVKYRIAVMVNCHNTQYTIGSVGISQATTWLDLDNLILTCLANHLQLIDPGKQLGLKTTSVRQYNLDSIRRTVGDVLPDVDVREMRGAILLDLKSGVNCDNISYDSLLPISFLKIAQSTLKMEHVICVSGPRYSGKTYVAELLSKNLLLQIKPDDQVQNVILYESGELQDSESLKKFENRLTSSTTPVVTIINDYKSTLFSADTLKLIRDSSGYKNSYIILLSEEGDSVIRDVRVVRCSAVVEPYHGLLDRHFNRVASIQSPEKRVKLKHIFNWLVSVWRHVNDTLKQHVNGECLIGPTHFLSCPADVDISEEWFLALWNMTLTPLIISSVKRGLTLYGRKHACWADPVEFIKGSYPWTTSTEYCDLLQGVDSSQINFDSYRCGPLIGGSNLLSTEQIGELVRCLKEHLQAANTVNTTPSSTPCQSSRDLARDPTRNFSRESSRESSSRDLSREGLRDLSREGLRDLSREGLRDLPQEGSRDSDPMPPTRTTSVMSSGSDEGIIGGKESESYRSLQRRRTTATSPPKPLEGVKENGPTSSARSENGRSENGNFQRGAAGRQSMPANCRVGGDMYHNMYHGNQRPLNATPTRTAVNNSIKNVRGNLTGSQTDSQVCFDLSIDIKP